VSAQTALLVPIDLERQFEKKGRCLRSLHDGICIPFCLVVPLYIRIRCIAREKPLGLTRTNIYLDEKQLERLRAKSEADNIPVSELVRRAIDAYLAWNDPTYSPHPNQPERKAHSSPA
jgi:hypothetical protein